MNSQVNDSLIFILLQHKFGELLDQIHGIYARYEDNKLTHKRKGLEDKLKNIMNTISYLKQVKQDVLFFTCSKSYIYQVPV